MDADEKLVIIKHIQQEIETNKTRLENAEQNVRQYLENLEILNNQLRDILSE